MALAFSGKGGGGSAFNGGTITEGLSIELPDTTSGNPLEMTIDGLNQWGIAAELGDVGGGVFDADISITGESATGRGLLILSTGTGSSQTRVGSDAITMDSGSNTPTDILFQIDSNWWGTLLAITAAETQVGAPMRFAFPPILQNHSAPADGSLSAGDCALWFDQTNGAAKLMVKAKQADGTVVTGSLALA